MHKESHDLRFESQTLRQLAATKAFDLIANWRRGIRMHYMFVSLNQQTSQCLVRFTNTISPVSWRRGRDYSFRLSNGSIQIKIKVCLNNRIDKGENCKGLSFQTMVSLINGEFVTAIATTYIMKRSSTVDWMTVKRVKGIFGTHRQPVTLKQSSCPRRVKYKRD